MRRETKESGVTLVALIITVIILIILAAVSIKQMTDHGMADVAIEGTEGYIYEQVKERISTAINEALIYNFDSEKITFSYNTLPEDTMDILKNEGYKCVEATSTEEGWALYKVTGSNPAVTFEVHISRTNGQHRVEVAQ